MDLKTISLTLTVALILTSCSGDSVSSLGGDPSPQAAVGVTITGSCYNSEMGIGSIEAEITSLNDGISSITGTTTVSNENIKNILSNDPHTEINGDQVTLTDIEFKNTTDGIAAVNGLAEGIIVKYDAKVGDEYKTEDGTVRTVMAVSTEDDFFWGFMMIKVIEVEEHPNKLGVKTIRYFANHRFGMVNMQFTFDDETVAAFPVYTSVNN